MHLRHLLGRSSTYPEDVSQDCFVSTGLSYLAKMLALQIQYILFIMYSINLFVNLHVRVIVRLCTDFNVVNRNLTGGKG